MSSSRIIVIDTNVYSNMRYVFDKLKKTGQTYSQLWESFDSELDRLSAKDRITYKGAIDFILRIRELKGANVQLNVPSFVYNEAVLGQSSKIGTNPSINTQKDAVLEFINSIPLKKVIDDTVLEVGEDLPTKSSDLKKQASIMEDFLKNTQNDNVNLQKLLEHLSQTTSKQPVQDNTSNLKNLITDVHDKHIMWDSSIREVLKANDMPYPTKTELLNTVYGKIIEYPEDLNKISFSDPHRVLAERLIKSKEEFDFFDLQIYMHAKEHDAAIFTLNTQAFQEINDPVFLGYFSDNKIMHTLINFEEIGDMSKAFGTSEVIKSSILDDFDSDRQLLTKGELKNEEIELEKLREPINRIIEQIQSSYHPSDVRLKSILEDKPLGGALKILRYRENELKISKKSAFNTVANAQIENQIKLIDFVGKEFLDGRLNANSFLNDGEALSTKKLAPLLKDRNLVVALRDTLKDEHAFLNDFVKMGSNSPDLKYYFKALYVTNHYKNDDIEKLMPPLEQAAPEKLPPAKCPPGSSRRKREAAECRLTWDDIDKFDEGEATGRDLKKVIIDSDKFVQYIDQIDDPVKRTQLVQFVQQLVEIEEHREVISGNRPQDVDKLIIRETIGEHFGKVSAASGALNHGIIAKNILADLLTGNVEGLAINLGFLGGGTALSKVAESIFVKGTKYADSGKLILGNTFKTAAPFIGRLVSAFVVYDLVNQIKALKEGDKDALVGVVGDSIFLAADAVDIGATLLEAAGLVEGVSAVTGPIGLAIGGIVLVGTEVYFAVRQVDSIDKIIHLTGWEKFQEGVRAFFHAQPSHYLQELVEIKTANNKLAEQAINYLKDHDSIQRYVLPSAELVNGKVQMAKNNEITDMVGSSTKWHRARPDDPAGGKIFCAPEGDWENVNNVLCKCVNAIGVADINEKTNGSTLFNLGDGNDIAVGFKYKPNIFLLGPGHKNITGGSDSDVFILDKSVDMKNPMPGKIDGGQGDNILDYSQMTVDATIVQFYDGSQTFDLLLAKYFGGDAFSTDGSKPIKFDHVNTIIGRRYQLDSVYVTCGVKYIETRSGTGSFPDFIRIDSTYRCSNYLTMQLDPNTVVENESSSGFFNYFVNNDNTNITCTLDMSRALPTGKNESHLFFFDNILPNLTTVEYFHHVDNPRDTSVHLTFKDNNGKASEFHLGVDGAGGNSSTSGRTNSIYLNLKDNTSLRYHRDGLYAVSKTNATAESIIKEYSEKSIGISLFLYSVQDDAVICVGTDIMHDVLYNDPTHATYLIGGKGENVYAIVSGKEELTELPNIPPTTIYASYLNGQINTLDLHTLSRQIKEDLGLDLLIESVLSPEKMEINLFVDKSSLHEAAIITTVTIIRHATNVPWSTWCENFHVVLHSAPVILKCNSYNFDNSRTFNDRIADYRASDHYTPVPLTFKDQEVIVLTPDDVEPNTQIRVFNKIGYNRYTRFGDDLILTSVFDLHGSTQKPRSMLFKNFFKNSNFFYTLEITFNDEAIILKRDKERIKVAPYFDDTFNEYSGYISDTRAQKKRHLTNDREQSEGNNLNKMMFSTSSAGRATSVLNTLWQHLKKPLNYLLGQFESHITVPPLSVHLPFNDYGNPSARPKYISTEADIVSQCTFDTNGTLLLLDVLIRKANSSSYMTPLQESALSPENMLQKRCTDSMLRVGLNPYNVEESIQQNYLQLLENF